MATETLPNIATGTVPYDDAQEANDLMFDVLTLLHAALAVTENHVTSVLCRHGLTAPSSRLDNLLLQAQDKCAAAIEKLNV